MPDCSQGPTPSHISHSNLLSMVLGPPLLPVHWCVWAAAHTPLVFVSIPGVRAVWCLRVGQTKTAREEAPGLGRWDSTGEESTGRDGREAGWGIWTYPKSVVGPGSPRDLVALSQGALVHRCWAFLGAYPRPHLHVAPPSSARGSQPPVYAIPSVSHGCR